LWKEGAGQRDREEGRVIYGPSDEDLERYEEEVEKDPGEKPDR